MKRMSVIIIILLLLLSNLSFAEGEGKVYVIPIKGEINRATGNFVGNAINDLNKENVEAIIFEIDTYGGLIDQAQRIKDSIISTNIPVKEIASYYDERIASRIKTFELYPIIGDDLRGNEV